MPTLNWIGKEAVVNHHQHVPFHLLKDVPDLACGDPGSGNLIVQGDNLVALIRGLMAQFAISDVSALALDRFRLRDEIETRIQQHRESERKTAFQIFLLPQAPLAVTSQRTINFKT